MKTFSEWQEYIGSSKKLGKLHIHSFHQSALFHWCEKHIPYWPIPFISKRTRVKIRWYFKHHWWNKVNRRMVRTLMKLSKSRGYKPAKYVIPDGLEAIEWEIIAKNNG